MDGEAYLRGARVLGRSLLKSGSKYSLLIIVPESMSEKIEKIEDENVKFLIKPHIGQALDNDMAFSRYAHCLDKLHLWTLIGFEKVCWLDADMIVLQNIDHLFDQDVEEFQIAMASGCTCNALNNPKVFTRPQACPFNDSQQKYGNTGLFLTRPSMKVFQDLLKIDYNHPFPDQDAFNIYFGERSGIIALNSKYNFLNHLPIAHPRFIPGDKGPHLSSLADRECVSNSNLFGDVAVFHFCYGKPWDRNILDLNHEFYQYWNNIADELGIGGS